MAYLRLLIALLSGSITFEFGFLMLKLFGNSSINAVDWLSKPIVYLGLVSILPLIIILSKTWKEPLLKVSGLKENALLLSCTYNVIINNDLESTKERIKDIAFSIIFDDRQLFLEYESNNCVDFYIGKKEDNRIENKKKNAFINNSIIKIDICQISKYETKVKIKVFSENPISLYSNSENRQIMNLFVKEIISIKNLEEMKNNFDQIRTE